MPKSNLAKKTQQYSLEFKRKSVEMTFDPDALINDVALAPCAFCTAARRAIYSADLQTFSSVADTWCPS
ncbi:hypothetical protein NFC81_04410 [Salinispirillum sp. LH 10-3-1]|uniref:Transposase n=1 Tax=Salinispirillum sp. LH 10-3-1 TaxID=2952525 RepID=A0AB38YI69_9GAMM